MINPKIIMTVKKVVAALVPFLYALAGGTVAASMQKCSKQEPVTLVITNQQYETKLSEIKATQDSISRVLPTMSESLRYLSERYGKPGEK